MTLKAHEIKVGQSHQEIVVEDLKRTQIVMYAGASGDFHAFHTDETYAKALGMPSVLGHGMLTMGMSGRALTNFVGDGRLTHYSARFTGQVWPGDTLTTTVTIDALYEEQGQSLADLTISTSNDKGDEVLVV